MTQKVSNKMIENADVKAIFETKYKELHEQSKRHESDSGTDQFIQNEMMEIGQIIDDGLLEFAKNMPHYSKNDYKRIVSYVKRRLKEEKGYKV